MSIQHYLLFCLAYFVAVFTTLQLNTEYFWREFFSSE